MLHGLMQDDYPLTLTPMLERGGIQFPANELVSRLPDGSIRRTTYGGYYARTKQLANALARLGIQPGDRVATLCWNHDRHLELYYGVPIMGGVLHTLNTRLHANDLAFIVNDAADRVLFVDRSLLPVFEGFRDQVNVEHVVVIPDDGPTPDGYLDYETLIGAESAGFAAPALDERQAAGMCYTSGTTGNPKGVLYSHRSTVLHTLMCTMVDTIAIGERECILPVVPMFHANAWGFPYAGVFTGAKQVFAGRDVSAPIFLDLIEQERVTFTAGVPSVFLPVLEALDADPDRWDVSSLRTIMVGGAAAPPSLINGFMERHGVLVTQAWGMTEMSPVGAVSRMKRRFDGLDESELLPRCARQGYPVPFVEFRHVNDEGEVQPWDGEAPGELEVRGPWVAASYYSQEGSSSFTADGWFKTGDIVTIDPEGYMAITDRAKDVIKSGGEWISTVALENALMAHPAVLEAAVFAGKHPRWDERPLAAVVFRSGRSATVEELREHLAPHFVRFWLPDDIIVLDEMPKTATGKFKKTELRDRYSGHLLEQGAG